MALRRTLGLAALTFFGVGLILGAGIYSVIGVAAREAGDALWQSFAVGGACALLTGLAYAELATTYPQAGAEYVYVRRAVPRARALAAVIGILVALAAVAMTATVARAFAGYLGALVELPEVAVSLGLVAACTVLNLVGMRESTWVNIAFTLVELGGLVLFIAVGVGEADFGAALAAPPAAPVLGAAALVFFAYVGFEQIANLAEEARVPARDIPRALGISIVVTTVVYVLVALAATALVDAATLGASRSPLSTAVAGAAPWAAPVLAGIALFATANTALIGLITASRLIYGIARGGDLPAALARVSRRGTPWVAALVLAAIAAVAVPLTSLGEIASLSSFAALIAFAAVHTSLVVLRRREPARERPFRVPGAIRGVPVVAVLGLATTIALLTQFEGMVYAVGAGAIGVAVAVHLLARATTPRRAAAPDQTFTQPRPTP